MSETSKSSSQSAAHPRAIAGKFSQYRAFVFLLAGGLSVWILFPFLKPLIMGAVVAVVLYPIYLKLTQFIRSAPLCALIMTLLFLFVVVLPFAFLLFAGAQKALQYVHYGIAGAPLDMSAESLLNWLRVPALVAKLNSYIPVDYHDISAFIMRGLNSAGLALSSVLQSTIAEVPNALISGMIMVIAVYFFLVDGPRLVRFFRENSCFDQRQTDQLIRKTQLTCRSVINASLVVGLVQALLMTVAGLLTGVPSLALLALITFFASFVPAIGVTPVPIGFAVYYLMNNQTTAAAVFLITLAAIVMSDNFVRPWVIRGGANLHPLMAFVAAFGGIAVLGFYGLFLGPIILSIFITMIPIFTQSESQS